MPRAALSYFPYDHGSLAQNNTSDPRAWRLANKARFDAIYGPATAPAGHAHRICEAERQKRLAEARAWRVKMKPHFDALYGTKGSR